MARNFLNSWKTSEDSLVRVFRNSAWLFSSKGVSAILSLFYLAVVTRSLGVAGFGTFILIVSTGQIVAAFFRVQTWQAIVQFGTPLLIGGDRNGFRRIARRGFFVEAGGGLLACVLMWFLLPPLARQFGLEPDIQSGLLTYTLILLFAVRSTPTGILRAQDRFRDGAIGDVAIPVVRMAGAIVLVLTAPTMMGFLIVWGVSELVCALILWLLVWRRGSNPDGHLPAQLSQQPAAEMPTRSLFFRFLLATNLSHLLNVIRERFVVIIVGLFVGAVAAGLFRLADQLANSINRLTEIFARPIFAELSRLYGQKNFDDLSRLFFRSLRISAIAGISMFLVLVLLGQPLIHLMSGSEYLAAYPLLLLLAAATIINLVGVGLEPLIQASDRAGAAFLLRLFSLLVLLGLLAVLLPGYAATGAAVAMLLSSALGAAMLLWTSWTLLKEIRPGQSA
ncbi:Membrane protein involved in the export of O-antigen and teichoic acid [Parasphingorhabdus marina DSM 22363]|uniref:Membrane protein involved in the export of O-antigen and teichoic acid n=1 Tax=Parasphingorhabdus marina DSM 22363 TaxID=1123272 RepID=A0A1N6CQZ9_9SPHN|nr:oligosaccharide flippase family protein [Parasphingorhabdus marina]SIN61001.1 Membrane protein involved in the export of O-antigen and teichoic acid [Parasphingorhabdus marina DSM 22363]